MTCFVHDGVQAVGTCRACGRGLCRPCADAGDGTTRWLNCGGDCARAVAVVEGSLRPQRASAQVVRARWGMVVATGSLGLAFAAVGLFVDDYKSERWVLVAAGSFFTLLGLLPVFTGLMNKGRDPVDG